MTTHQTICDKLLVRSQGDRNAANSFGWKAFGIGDSSKIRGAANQKLSIRYGILLHSASDAKVIDLHAAYRDYLQVRKHK